MRISTIKREARATLRGQWGLAVAICLVGLGIANLTPSLVQIPLSGGFGNWVSQESPNLGITIFSNLLSFLLYPITIGVSWLFLDMARSKKVDVGQIFTIFADMKLYLKLLLASIVVSVFTFLWALLLIIPGIIKWYSYSQVFYILKDRPELSVMEAIRESQRMMKGYKWKLFLLQLSFIGWGILSIFTLFIGFLWLVPYMTASYAEFYNNLSATDEIE